MTKKRFKEIIFQWKDSSGEYGKRFRETISTGIVTDTKTGKEYNCEMRIDDELLNLLNDLTEENEQLKKQIQDMQIRFKRKYDYEFDEIVDELW